jgi:hypothetical protein
MYSFVQNQPKCQDIIFYSVTVLEEKLTSLFALTDASNGRKKNRDQSIVLAEITQKSKLFKKLVMNAKLTNKTLERGWGFNLELFPAFQGNRGICVTDSDKLLLGDDLDPGFTIEDLFLIPKTPHWIKRFSGFKGQKDIFIQITPEQAAQWLLKNGYIDDPENVSLDELLRNADRINPMKCSDDNEQLQDSRKFIRFDNDYPSNFQEGTKEPKTDEYPTTFNEW